MSQVFATWDSTACAASIALSLGDLKATTTQSNAGSVKATLGKSSGKWYWEVAQTGTQGAVIGVANSSLPTSAWVGMDGNGKSYYSNGYVFSSGSGVPYGAAYSDGAVIGVALDMDAGTVSFYLDGVYQGVAFSGLTGVLYPAVGTGGDTSCTFTANFGETAFAYTPPEGFSGLYSDYGTTEATHWRIRATDASWTADQGGYIAAVRSVYAYASTDRSGPNLASGVVASASSQYDATLYTPDKAFDGINDTAWANQSGLTSLSWLQFILPTAATIRSLRIDWWNNTGTGSTPRKFDLQYSLDSGVTWTTAASGAVGNPGTSDPVSILTNIPVLVVSTDQLWNKVVCAMPMDGEDNSTSFVDLKGHTFTAVGNAKITTAIKRMGTASASFDGVGDYAYMAVSDDFTFPGDFAVDGWLRPTASASTADVIGTGTNYAYLGSGLGGWTISLCGDVVHFGYQFNNSWVFEAVFTGSSVPLNTDTYFRLYREDGVIRLAINGVLNPVSHNYSGTLTSNAYGLHVGCGAGAFAYLYTGSVDDLRITKGASRSADLSVPTEAFPTSQGAPTATAPDAPTSVVASSPTASSLSVAFTAPVNDGGSPITSYTVTSNPGGKTATGLLNPLVVSGLSFGTSYTFTVTATNAIGASEASEASEVVRTDDKIVASQLGVHSFQLVVPAGAIAAEVLHDLRAVIADYGWDVHDSAYNVFRCLNADGVTYKYLRLAVVGTTDSYATTEVYESWNGTTHVGLNRAGPNLSGQTVADYSKTAFRLTSPTQINTVNVYCSPRWLAFGSYTDVNGVLGYNQTITAPNAARPESREAENTPKSSYDVSINTYSGVSGCFEFSREGLAVHGEVPCFFWTHTAWSVDDKLVIDTTNNKRAQHDAFFTTFEPRSQISHGILPSTIDQAGTKYTQVPITFTTAFVDQMDGRFLREPNAAFPPNVFNGMNQVIDLPCRSQYGFLGVVYGLKLCHPDNTLPSIFQSKDFTCDSNFNIVKAGYGDLTKHWPIVTRLVKSVAQYDRTGVYHSDPVYGNQCIYSYGNVDCNGWMYGYNWWGNHQTWGIVNYDNYYMFTWALAKNQTFDFRARFYIPA